MTTEEKKNAAMAVAQPEGGVITGASIDLAVDEIGLRLTGDED